MKLQKAIKQLQNGAYGIKNSTMNVGIIELHDDNRFWFKAPGMNYTIEVQFSNEDFLDETWETVSWYEISF